jgi:hypothetical protein
VAGLPWIKLSIDVVTHPKSLHLGAILEDPDAWRFPVRLWCWCASHAPDGRLEGVRALPSAVEGAAGWPGKRGELLAGLVACGFLDQTPAGFLVHGWEERAYGHLAKQARDRTRANLLRAKARAAAGLGELDQVEGSPPEGAPEPFPELPLELDPEPFRESHRDATLPGPNLPRLGRSLRRAP